MADDMYMKFSDLESQLYELSSKDDNFQPILEDLLRVGESILETTDKPEEYSDISHKLMFWEAFRNTEGISSWYKDNTRNSTDNVVPLDDYRSNVFVSKHLRSLLRRQDRGLSINFVYMRYFDSAFGETQDPPKPPFREFLKKSQEYLSQHIGEQVYRKQIEVTPEDRLGHVDSLQGAVDQILRFTALAAEPGTWTEQRKNEADFYPIGAFHWMGVLSAEHLASSLVDENPGLVRMSLNRLEAGPSKFHHENGSQKPITMTEMLFFCLKNNISVTTRSGTAVEDFIVRAHPTPGSSSELSWAARSVSAG
jgi:hypothetical protein